MYLPLLDVLDGAPVTLGLTPVLCDQLEAMRADAGDRFLRFLREIRAPIHAEDAAGLDDPGETRWRPSSAGGGRLPRADEALRGAGGTCSAPSALERRRALDVDRHPWAPAADGHGRRGRLQLATGVAAHQRRFGDWEGGFWLPECAYVPGLERDLADHGVRIFCVDQTAVPGRPPPPVATDAGPVAVPIDWDTIELVWCDQRGYPVHGGCYRNYWGRKRPRPEAVEQRRTAVRPRCRARARARACARLRRARAAEKARRTAACSAARSTPSCSGTGGTRGSIGFGAVFGEAEAQGVRLVTVSEGVELARAGHAAARTRGPGAARRTSRPGTRPPWRRSRGRARDAELRTVAAVATPAPRTLALERAARELLAIQASDWAFMVTRELAATTPPRLRLHATVPRRCACRSDRLTGRTRAVPHDLAPDLDLSPLTTPCPNARPDPVLGVPTADRGRTRAHVRKLAENLAAQGVDVHVLARGREEDPHEEQVGGVTFTACASPSGRVTSASSWPGSST